MATPYLLRDCKFYGEGYDLSGSLNRGKLSIDVNILDTTPFNVSSTTKIAGMLKASLDFDGYYEAGSGLIDDILDSQIGAAEVPYSVYPNDAIAGSIGFSFAMLAERLARSGKYGDLLILNLNGQSSGPVFRQTLMELGSKSAGGNGTARQIGAVAAGQKAYGIVHVLSGSGTLGLKLQSSATAGGTYVDRATFTSLTGIGAQIAASAAGPITDTYWRFQWTVSDGPFSVIMGAGII
ncbi:MAG: hypothetical protein WC375_07925 [Methanomassiliicoccales archaeon]|jgi:hypothetical protein